MSDPDHSPDSVPPGASRDNDRELLRLAATAIDDLVRHLERLDVPEPAATMVDTADDVSERIWRHLRLTDFGRHVPERDGVPVPIVSIGPDPQQQTDDAPSLKR